MDFAIGMLQALGLDLVLMLFCYVMVSILEALGYDLYYYRGSGRFLPMGTADLRLWREGFHRCVRTPVEEEPANYYVLRDRDGLQLTLRHKLLLLALTFSWSDVFLLVMLCLGHLVRTGDLHFLTVRLVPQLLLWLALALAGGLACYLSIRQLRAQVLPRRAFMNNVGAWLEKNDSADMVMGLSFFHAVQRMLSPDELARLVDSVPGLVMEGDPERGGALIRQFFLLLDTHSAEQGRSWLFDLTEDGLNEYRKLSRMIEKQE